jgi:uncharacterized delta-60 repeat protein
MNLNPALWTAALGLLAACSSPSKPTPNPSFTLQPAADKLPILQGSGVTLKVTLERQSGFDGAVNLTLSGLPSGVSAAPAIVAAGATSAELRLEAAASAPHSLPTPVTLEGTSGTAKASQTLTVTVRGPAGSLDTSFGGGIQVTPVGAGEDYGQALAVQPDGKVLLAGHTVSATGGEDFALVRYNRDGGLDTAFGSGGKVVTPVGSGSDQAYAVALQPDGKIVVGGSAAVSPSDLDFALVRYNPDGSLDPSFGSGGKVLTALGGVDHVFALAIQPDGKIVAGGDTDSGTGAQDFALARYNPNGSLDSGFGSGGKVSTPIRPGTTRDSIYGLALQTVGGETRIVAAGGEGDFILARYTPAGQLDETFGEGGKVDGLFASSIGAARAVVVTGGSKLLVAGHTDHDFALVRLLASGSPDAAFGTDGKVVTPLSKTNWDEAQALAVQADGKIVVGGWVYSGAGSSGDFAAVHYSPEGALDPGFGSGGVVITPVGGAKDDQARAVALQPEERVPTVRILVGGSVNGSNHDLALARYWP